MGKTDSLWWQTGVLYQIYPRSFQDDNGDGVGDLAGILNKLDYLSDTLGVDAMWLSPFYPSPMADFGYDVSNYTDVHPMFGDLATFDRLVAEAHRRGLRVVIDYVPNHTSDRHPWFLESRSSRDNPKRDWYIWRDPKPDGALPNNWLSLFGGPAWGWDEETRQYYLHSFLKEQPDLNWRNPEVKAAMLDVLRFWLARGVDGFRIDVAHFIMKDPELRDNPLNPYPVAMQRPLGEYDTQLHVHSVGHPDVHQVFREIRAVLNSFSDPCPRFCVGEIHEFDWSIWTSFYGDQLDELHMPFNFQFLVVPWKGTSIRSMVDGLEAHLPHGAWPNYVLGNHDESRIASRLGRAQVRVAMMLLLTLRGTPTLYYGDELSMVDVDIPHELLQDPWGLRVPGFGRDPGRTPMQWSSDPNAGFAPATTRFCWLPLAPDCDEVNVAQQIYDPRSMLTLTRRLLSLRRATPALHMGSYRGLDATDDACLIFVRELADEDLPSTTPADPMNHESDPCPIPSPVPDAQAPRRFLVALNLTGEAQQVATELEGGGRILLSTHLDREGAVGLARFALRENEGLIIAVE